MAQVPPPASQLILETDSGLAACLAARAPGCIPGCIMANNGTHIVLEAHVATSRRVGPLATRLVSPANILEHGTSLVISGHSQFALCMFTAGGLEASYCSLA
jgi:hypothetical protein